MISLILPFWMRQEAADKAIASLERHYGALDLEVIVVDDGSEIPFINKCFYTNIRVIQMPRKSGPKSPISAWNLGVKHARGDVIVLSCVEVIHEMPVLAEMERRVREAGEDAYVLAAAWCPEEGKWHTHSTVQPPHNPPGTGIGFCAALHKSLFERAGGFDEDYREGAGYEDCDWINRLLVAGAKFIHADDLKVIHPKSGASIAWGADKFERNRDLYFKKWPQLPSIEPVNFVCLKAGAMYGPEYVNILFDMVRRNLPAGYPGRFVCITDDPAGLSEGIETIALPADLEGWWGKLWMLKSGIFPDNSRCVFMDLDTAIVGPLAPIFGYGGEMATLRDLGGRGGLGPAVILWRAGGKAAEYWDRWDAAGRPKDYHGDKGWLEHCGWEGDYLQDLYPGAFRSFKLECDPMFPKGTRVVCFHGEPRPHNASADWVKHCWKIGGGTAAELEATCNTHFQTIAANVRKAMQRGLPILGFDLEHDGQAVIVGGGPSLESTLGEIKWRSSLGQTIFACNGAGRYLMERGIVPDYIVILDARPENADFAVPGVHHILASHCDPSTFNAARYATVYHANTQGVDAGLGEGEHILISTGATVGLVAIGIAHVMGYRKFHLYGMDSSIAESHHAYPQPLNDKDAVIECIAGGERFKCAPWMLLQAQQFQSLASQLAEEGCIITVAGSGLLPHIAREMGKLPEAA